MHIKTVMTTLQNTCFALILAAAGRAAADESSALTDMVSDDLAFAISVPSGFQLENGDATLTLEYEAGTTKLYETFNLDVSRSASFAKRVDAAGEVYIGRLGPASKQRFEQVQKTVARDQAAQKNGRGGIAVAVTGGCFSGAPLDRLPISTWVQVDASHGYIKVVRNRNLLSLLDAPTRNRLIANLRTCL